MEEKVKLLIAVGASVTANCQACLEHLVTEARNHGIEEKEIFEAIAVAKMVRKGAAGHMDEFSSSLIGEEIVVAEDSKNGWDCS